MQNKPLAVSILSALMLVTIMPLSGCQMFESSSKDYGQTEDAALQAVVIVEDTEFGGEVPITVQFAPTRYRDAVGQLRIKDWEGAIALLTELVAKEGIRGCKAQAYFAIGVAHEASGDYEAAQDAYRQALAIDNRSRFEDGIARAEAALNNN